MAASKRLLVNADDFGLSSAMNHGIIESHRNGIVRSTSIVASGAAFEEAISEVMLHPSLGVGVHLTLVEENAASPTASTLAPHGVLPATYGKLMKDLCLGKIRLRDVEQEFRAQIEKCIAAGIKPTHLDSHQHTHAFPSIYALTIKLANEYRICGIRIPRGRPRLSDISAARFLPKCALCVLATGDALFLPRRNCSATRHFAGLFETGDLTTQAALRILNSLRVGTTELVCHPGCDDPSGKYIGWNKRRQVELVTLTSQEVKQAVSALGIELISYRQLCAGSEA